MNGHRSRFSTAWAVIPLTMTACGGKTLDLGRSAPGSDYATPDTIAAEADAGLGDPTFIARNQNEATSLSIDATRVYWLVSGNDGHRVARSCAKSDCASTVVDYSAPNQQLDALETHRTASNGTDVFWAGYLLDDPDAVLRIFSCPIEGCRASAAVIYASNVGRPINFAVADDTIFLLVEGEKGHHAFARCPATECRGNATILATVQHPPAPSSSIAFATDGANLYWIEGDGPSQTAGVIMTVATSGASPARVLAPAGHLVGALAVQGSNLYWSESHENAVMKTCDLSNCETTTTTLTTGETYPHYLAVLGDSATWFRCPEGSATGPCNGRLVNWPIDSVGRTPTVFPMTENTVTSLAVDATHAYWTTRRESATEHPAGSVKRIRRPH